MSDSLFSTFRTLLLVIAISVSGSFARITSTSLLMVSTFASQYYPAGLDVDDDGAVVFSSRDGCTISRLPRGGSVSVIAGVTSVCGFKDDVGTAARFNYPCGIARISSLLYIAEQLNNRIRVLDLTTYSVSTLTGSSPGSLDNPFPSALFYTPTDVHHFSTPVVSVLYILDYTNNAVRKADLRSKIVSTVATVTNPVFGCLNRNGTLLFLANDAQTIVRVDISGGTSVIIAGYAGSSGYQDNRGTMARFYDPRGVAFNADETAIYIGDWKNYRLRRIQLSNMSVTTVAGTGAISSINSLPRASTFQGFAQIIWYCDRLPTVCGIMAAEFAASGNIRWIRWIPFTQGTVTISSSISAAQVTSSLTHSDTHTRSESNEASLTRSMSFHTWTGDSTGTLSRCPSLSTALSLSGAVSNTQRSASPTPTVRQTRTVSLQRTSSLSSSMSTSLTPSPSLTSEVTVTKSPPTQTKSTTLFDCNALGPQNTGAALMEVNTSVLSMDIQLPFLANASSKFVPLGHATNASYPLHDQDRRNGPLLVFLSSQDVDRLTLLQALPMVFNLTLVSPYQLVYYYVGNVTAVQGTNVSATWSVHPRRGVWHGVVVEAPSAGWVGLDVFPVLLYTELNLLVPLMCGDGHAMLTVVLTVPSPGVPRILASDVRRATQAALIVALLATGALSGSALGRILATDIMVLCDADASGGGGVIDFGLTICTESPDRIEARSAILSNAVIVTAVCALLLLSGALWLAGRNRGLSNSNTFASIATLVFLLPSSMLPVLTSVMPSTAVSTTFLIARVASSPCVAVDVLLIMLGLLLIAAPVAALLYLALYAAASWTCVASPSERDGDNREHLGARRLRLHLRRAARRAWKWRALKPESAESLRPAWVVLLEYRVPSYAAIDALFLIAVSSLAVVGGLDVTNEALCRGCSAAVVVLLGAQVGVLCAWRPYTTLFSLVYNVATTALTCVSAAAQLAFVLTSFTSTSGLWLVEASAVCNLLVLGLSVVKMLLDAWELWAAVWRRIDARCFHKRDNRLEPAEGAVSLEPSLMVAEFLDDEVFEFLKPTRVQSAQQQDLSEPLVRINGRISPVVATEGNQSHDFGQLFWDDGGRAIGTSHAEELNGIITTVVR